MVVLLYDGFQHAKVLGGTAFVVAHDDGDVAFHTACGEVGGLIVAASSEDVANDAPTEEDSMTFSRRTGASLGSHE